MVGFRSGSSSGGSSSGIDFDSDYFNVPVVPLGTLNSIPGFANDLTGGDSSSINYSTNIPTYPAMTGPADYALYQGTNAHPMESGKAPNYFTTDSLTEQDIQNYLNDIENFTFNSSTGEYEPAGKYSYPLSQLAPEYSDAQDKFLLGITPGMSGDALQRIEANRLNVQRNALSDHMNTVNQMTGDILLRAESEANNPAPTTYIPPPGHMFDQERAANEQRLKDSGQIHSGSVFEPGGAFGGKQ